jgi:hypothetical protein
MGLRGVAKRSGFSLIEATVAATILLATCLTAGVVLRTALDAGRLIDRRAALNEVLAAERVRLAVLPYYAFAPVPAGGSSWDPGASSLLAQVFPHALASRNTAAAFYQEDEGSATFVTQRTLQGVEVRCEACFLRWTGTDWTVLPAAAVAGWAIWQSRALPAAMVEVHLTAFDGTLSSSMQVRLGATRPTVEKTSWGLGSDDAA